MALDSTRSVNAHPLCPSFASSDSHRYPNICIHHCLWLERKREPHYVECHNCHNMISEPKCNKLWDNSFVSLFRSAINSPLNACELDSNECLISNRWDAQTQQQYRLWLLGFDLQVSPILLCICIYIFCRHFGHRVCALLNWDYTPISETSVG